MKVLKDFFIGLITTVLLVSLSIILAFLLAGGGT